MPGQSVGAVKAQRARFDQPLQLRSGGILPAFDLIYETYGTLNAAGSNAIRCPFTSRLLPTSKSFGCTAFAPGGARGRAWRSTSPKAC